MATSPKSPLTPRTLAMWGLVLVALGYSVLGANSRLLNQGFQPITQVYVRIFVGFFLSLIFFGRSIRMDIIRKTSRNDWLWLSIMGILGYSVGVWMITLANLNAKLVNSAVIYATIPFIVYIYSFFLLKEKFRWALIGLLVIALYGISVISSKSFIPAIGQFGIGELFAFLSVLASGWWSVGRKKLSDHLNNKEITILTMLIAGLTGVVIAVIKGETLSLHSFTLPTVLIGIAIGAVLNFGLTFLENFSFKNIDAVLGNQIIMLSTLFSLAIGFVFYGERITFPEVIGGLLIFLSVLWGNVLFGKYEKD
jgi:drug/metabolite transporter (DMT)-like permease